MRVNTNHALKSHSALKVMCVSKQWDRIIKGHQRVFQSNWFVGSTRQIFRNQGFNIRFSSFPQHSVWLSWAEIFKRSIISKGVFSRIKVLMDVELFLERPNQPLPGGLCVIFQRATSSGSTPMASYRSPVPSGFHSNEHAESCSLLSHGDPASSFT